MIPSNVCGICYHHFPDGVKCDYCEADMDEIELPGNEEVSLMFQSARDDEDLAERAYRMGVRDERRRERERCAKRLDRLADDIEVTANAKPVESIRLLATAIREGRDE